MHKSNVWPGLRRSVKVYIQPTAERYLYFALSWGIFGSLLALAVYSFSVPHANYLIFAGVMLEIYFLALWLYYLKTEEYQLSEMEVRPDDDRGAPIIR